ncbi:MAG: oxidoreductase family protein, partial [Flavobacteriaceae bacterium]
TYMGKEPKFLWKTGTYWHLETRPEELEAIKDKDLKNAASQFDLALKATPFQTIVHGDAKLANFCFSKMTKTVAAVDFQYAGRGCGMKDVAYFIGSCLHENDCERYESYLLDIYFNSLATALKTSNSKIDSNALEQNWRMLYPIAWSDFHRFLKGWSPGHWKLNAYSENMLRKAFTLL